MNLCRILVISIVFLLKTGAIFAQSPEAIKYYNQALNLRNGTNGVAQNEALANEYFLKAAKLGHAMAQAECTRNEKLSKAERVSWARKSAEQNCWLGIVFLFNCYNDGDMGLPKDESQAFYWSKRWAETGHPAGLYVYGLYLFEGRLTQKNIDEGFSYLEKSANLGYKDAIYDLCQIYSEGNLRCDATLNLPHNYEKYLYWLRKGAEQGLDLCQLELGACYYDGKSVKQSNEDAFKWWKKAADNGNAQAQYNVGKCYYEGIGVQKDDRLAINWFKNSAKNGNVKAKEALSILGESY